MGMLSLPKTRAFTKTSKGLLASAANVTRGAMNS
jgi:hypothetical protein